MRHCEICDNAALRDGPPTVEEAVHIIEHSRHVHVEWAEWLDAHPEDLKPHERLGNRDFHRRCVARYDRVLEVLRARVQ